MLPNALLERPNGNCSELVQIGWKLSQSQINFQTAIMLQGGFNGADVHKRNLIVLCVFQ